MKDAANIHLGFVLPDLRFSFWALLGHSAREHAAELGVTLSSASIATVEDQLAACERFIQQRVDALLIGPFQGNPLIPIVQKANAAGIPIIVLDNDIPGGQVACTVRTDSLRGGELAGAYLAERLAGRGKVVNVQGSLMHQASQDRSQGLHKILAQYPDMPIVFEACGDWVEEGGEQAMRQALAEHPDIQAVFAANDPMALGVIKVIKEAGLEGQIIVVGFDGLPDGLLAIHNGAMGATIGQQARTIGVKSIDLALQLVQGHPIPELALYEPVVITAENLLDAAMESLVILPGIIKELLQSFDEQRQLQQSIIASQRNIIQELSSPIIPLSEEVLVLPLIGAIDSLRAAQIMETMLEEIARQHARVLIIDITGVAVIDTGVAHHLLKAVSAARLLGTTTILAGITPEIAQTIIQLGIDLSEIQTHSSLQTSLTYAITRLGVEIGRGGRHNSGSLHTRHVAIGQG